GKLLNQNPIDSDRFSGKDLQRSAKGSQPAGELRPPATRVASTLDDSPGGKDGQRGGRPVDEWAPQFSAPWIVNAASRDRDDGASGAAAQPYARGALSTERAAEESEVRRAGDSNEPARDATSIPEDEADRWEAPADLSPHVYQHEDTRFGLNPENEKL